MVHICEIFAAEYDIKFNEENTVAIINKKSKNPRKLRKWVGGSRVNSEKKKNWKTLFLFLLRCWEDRRST